MKLQIDSIKFGQRHPGFNHEDFQTIRKVCRLSRTHQKLCAMNCNGEGWIKGKFYRLDNNMSYVNVDTGVTVFDAEIEKIEKKIKNILSNQPKFAVEFQEDPRGSTVLIFYENERIYLE